MGKRRFRFFKIKKKHLKRVAWLASVLLAGYVLFSFYQHYWGNRDNRPVLKPGKPKIVFVIDDIGNEKRHDNILRDLGDKVTYAILPLQPYSRSHAEMSRKTNAEVILHLPLDTTLEKIPGRGLIVDTMSDDAILEMLDRDLDSVPYSVGANNHMGSRGTSDTRIMTLILRELKRRGLFFLDSYTTRESVVQEVGRKLRAPVLTRGVFLDNVDEKPAIRVQIEQLREAARKKGSAIGIGHYRKNTLEVLRQEIPRLEKEGFQIISLRDLLKIHRN